MVWKKFSLVALGALSAQIIGLAALPLITKVVNPEEMGYYARALAIGMAASVVLTLRLEAAVFASSTLGRQLQTAYSAIAAALLMSGVAALVLVANPWAVRFTAALGFTSVKEVQFCLLIGLALAIMNSITNAAAAAGSYGWLALSRPAKQLVELGSLAVIASMPVAIYWLSAAPVVACVLASIVLAVGIARPGHRTSALGARRHTPRLLGMAGAARRYWRFSLADLPSAFAVHASMALPLIILTERYDLKTAGMFALSQRIVNAPVALAAQSIGVVFRAELRRAESPLRLFSRTALLLTLGGAAIFGTVALVPMHLMGKLFGQDWVGLYEFLIPMLMYGFVRMLAMPLSYAMYVTESVRLNTAMQGLHILGLAVLFWVVGANVGALAVVRIFVAAEVVFYLGYLLVALRATVQLDRSRRT